MNWNVLAAGCALIMVVLALMAWITQLLWNVVLVGVLHIGTPLDYWAALGVYLALAFVGNFFRNVSLRRNG